LRDARQRKGLTQRAVAQMFDVTEQAVSQWERNESRPDSSRIFALARLYGVDAERLLHGQRSAVARAEGAQRAVRIVNAPKRHAGGLGEPDGPAEADHVQLDEHNAAGPDCFALQIFGESNLPDYRPGDIVIIDPAVEPLPGDMVAAQMAGSAELVFRRYRPRGTDRHGQTRIELAPLNADWPTLEIAGAGNGKIVGTMIEHRRYRARRSDHYRGA
jgi:SOS-response transcriptional repressor LexA